jgi:hypothetical protein
MPQNLIASLGQAISQLLSTDGSILQATGLDIFRGLASILIVWFGVKAALSAGQGGGGFHFAKFADLLLLISFGFGMLTYYSTPAPGMGYSFSDLITKEGLSLANQIEANQTQQIADTVTAEEQNLGSPPGSFDILEDLTYLLITVILALMEAAAFAVIGYGYVAAAVCVLLGPIFIPFFIVPKLDWLFWGWLKALSGSASIRSLLRPSSTFSLPFSRRCSRRLARSLSRMPSLFCRHYSLPSQCAFTGWSKFQNSRLRSLAVGRVRGSIRRGTNDDQDRVLHH